MKKYFLYTIISSILSCFVNEAFCFDDQRTHPDLTVKAVNNSNLDTYLKVNLGLTNGIDTPFPSNSVNTVKNLLRDGATAEDSPLCRASNHFHNPLKSWSTSQGSDFPLISLWCSSSEYNYQYSNVRWATGYLSPTDSSWEVAANKWDWPDARKYYLAALTSTNSNDRETNFANTFKALGQVMHLLEDMAVPAHTRNDFWAHLYLQGIIGPPSSWLGNPFEHYVKLNYGLVTGISDATVKSIAQSVATTNIPVTRFWDTEQYNEGSSPSTSLSLGLAEYTNANFASNYTIFTENFSNDDPHYFPYPRLSSTEQYEQVLSPDATVTYFRKNNDGENIEHFAVANRWYRYLGWWPSAQRTFIDLDNNCHADYADKLLPKAAGYSAGLLNYFFRGQMDTNGHETIDSNGNVNGISVEVRNITTNEEMNNGKLVVSYRYKVFGATDYTYGISSEVNSGTLTANAVSYTTYAFTFANTIPSNATEVQYILVFHNGYLGYEQNAVAAKKIDTEAFKIKLTRDGGVLLTPTSLADTSLPGPKNRAGAYIYIGLYDSSNNWVTGGTATFSNGQQTYNGITFDETTGYWKLNLPLGYKEPFGNKGFWMEYWSTIGTTYSRYPRVYQWSKFEDEKNLIHPGIYEDTIPLWWIEGPNYYPSIGYPSKVALKVHSSVPYLVQYSFAQQVAEYLVPETDPIQYLYYRVGETVTINGSKEINLPCMLYDQNTGSNEILDMESNGPSIDGTNFEESWELTDYCSTASAWYSKAIIRDLGGILAGFEF